ncbi:hypothetical protein R1flu_007007 [Riccia fluitans]|uniref:F-box/kelch-repeat protein n=1 Tax=Riccia fluitans TaxID=41844 RepID=A0ABD1YYF1_9MARC
MENSQSSSAWSFLHLKYEKILVQNRTRHYWRDLKFFCPLEKKWFSTPKRFKSFWSLVGSDGGLLCHQSLHNWRWLCVENPLKQPGSFMVPPIPRFDVDNTDEHRHSRAITGEHGKTVRMITNRDPDTGWLKIVLTIFPIRRTTTTSHEQNQHRKSTYAVVFDSREMRWTIFPREFKPMAGQALINGLAPTFLMCSVIFFRTEEKRHDHGCLTLVKFDHVSGVWDEMTFFKLPCRVDQPLSFMENDGRIYLMGTADGDEVKVWWLSFSHISVKEFLTSELTPDAFEWEVYSVMPTEIRGSLLAPVVGSSSSCAFKSISYSHMDDSSIFLKFKMFCVTYDVATNAWKSLDTYEAVRPAMAIWTSLGSSKFLPLE